MKAKLRIQKTALRAGKQFMLAVVLLSSLFVNAQTDRKANWREFSRKTSSNFYDVQRNFNQYWQNKPREKGKGFKVFKRWEERVEPRVYPSGNMLLPSTTYSNFVAWQRTAQTTQTSAASRIAGTGNWTALGPFVKPSGYDAGMGRVDFLRFDPTNNNIMYVGTPDGGLWKTVNGGASWTTNTDFLPVIGCTDLAINPTNTQIMYLATGNFENDRRTIGVLKTTDGGATWNTTGLVFTPQEDYRARRMIMDPTNPQIMMLATDGGIFRTTDGWATFSSVIAGAPSLFDIVFKPGDPNTVYAAGTEFYKSTNKGASWTKITAGLPPAASVSRIVLGVSPANAATVYAVMGDTEEGFLGLYRSTNSGTSFTLRSSAPNILNSSKDASGTGGQATHDLAIAVSPVNVNIVTVGGISQWRSNNGGANWTLLSYWYGSDPAYPGQGDGPPDYVHADVQSIQYLPGSGTTMFTTCDGGISKSVNNGTNWTDITSNISVSQEYSIALSATSQDIAVAGLQDIGTIKYQAGGSSIINGGDGLDALIDRTNNLRIITSNPFGAYDLTTDGTANRTPVTGLPPGTDFFAAIKQDPVNANTIYAGGRPALYRSTNFTSTWTMLGTPPGTNNILQFAIAPSNNSIIYAIKRDAFSRSANGGSTWTNKTGTLPVTSARLTNLTISSKDPDDVWVTFSGYADGVKVFETKNGGNTWTNVSAGLPNLPFNTIVYENGNNKDALYLGGDIGVYYLDRSLDAWVPYFTDLPRCSVRDLEIFYPTGKLRAATYGRGAWESDLNSVEGIKITASAGPNGVISPDGQVAVSPGANQTFTITPNAGYMVEDVKVDGNSVGAVITYTFTNVTTDRKIRATFKCRPFTLSAAVTNLKCNGEHVGAINLTVNNGTGPYTYAWASDGGYTSSSEDISGLDGGRYRITVTQAGGCKADSAFRVTEPDKLIIKSAKAENVSCFGLNDGFIKLTAKGGTPPYDATIDNANYFFLTGDSIKFSNLAPGSYTPVLFDDNFCSVTYSPALVITQPTAVGATLCYTSSSTTLHVFGSGGTAPYRYSIDGTNYRPDNTGDGGRDFNFSGGAYTVYVKDKKDCIYSISGNTNSLGSCAGARIAGRNSNEPATTINTTISPNPSEHQFTLQVTSSNTTQPIRVRVLDINQRVMYSSQGAVKGAYRFGENFRPGTYIVEITQGNERKTLKVIKE